MPKTVHTKRYSKSNADNTFVCFRSSCKTGK